MSHRRDRAWRDVAVLQSSRRRWPWRPGRFHHVAVGGFRSAQLNLAGWSALVGVGVVIGLVLSAASPLPWLLALAVGLVGAWAAALIEDGRRYRRLQMSLNLGLDLEATERLAHSIRQHGVDVSVTQAVTDDGQRSALLLVRCVDQRRVERIVASIDRR